MSRQARKSAADLDAEWLGKRVRSVAVGVKPAFTGIAEVRHPGHLYAFIVRDEDDGSCWHREPNELSLVPA